eukprot:10400067-Lingulodinium_polyedra.AAC.1
MEAAATGSHSRWKNRRKLRAPTSRRFSLVPTFVRTLSMSFAFSLPARSSLHSSRTFSGTFKKPLSMTPQPLSSIVGPRSLSQLTEVSNPLASAICCHRFEHCTSNCSST